MRSRAARPLPAKRLRLELVEKPSTLSAIKLTIPIARIEEMMMVVTISISVKPRLEVGLICTVGNPLRATIEVIHPYSDHFRIFILIQIV